MVSEDGDEVEGWVEYPDAQYCRDDVIVALIDEVRRLRSRVAR